MHLLYRSLYYLTNTWCRILYGHAVHGVEHLPKGKAIIAANHTSALDPILLGISSHPEELVFLARKTLFTPLLGPIIKRLNAYPIDQKPLNRLEALQVAIDLLAQDKKIVIFPEGHRSLDGRLAHLKQGAALLALTAQAPIVPVYIHGAYDIFNKTHYFPKLWGKTACIIGSPIKWQDYMALEKEEALVSLTIRLQEALEALNAWYEDGAVGSPP